MFSGVACLHFGLHWDVSLSDAVAMVPIMASAAATSATGSSGPSPAASAASARSSASSHAAALPDSRPVGSPNLIGFPSVYPYVLTPLCNPIGSDSMYLPT